MPNTQTMVLKLGYRGTNFCGYAAQPSVRTVAGELEGALQTLLRREVELTCAGRTDAGVHARAQYVSLPITQEEAARSKTQLLSSLNALTPDDISVYDLYRAAPNFSARFDACARHYRYYLFVNLARPLMSAEHAWWIRRCDMLDLDAMQKAAAALVGEHNFAAFCKKTSYDLLVSEGLSTCRELFSINICTMQEAGEGLIAIDICGNAFLHNMVRIIIGTLVEVGTGHKDPVWVQEVLDSCDRRCAGQTAPAQGLVFFDVDYAEGALAAWT